MEVAARITGAATLHGVHAHRYGTVLVRRNTVRRMRKPAFRLDTFTGASNELTADLECIQGKGTQSDMGAKSFCRFTLRGFCVDLIWRFQERLTQEDREKRIMERFGRDWFYGRFVCRWGMVLSRVGLAFSIVIACNLHRYVKQYIISKFRLVYEKIAFCFWKLYVGDVFVARGLSINRERERERKSGGKRGRGCIPKKCTGKCVRPNLHTFTTIYIHKCIKHRGKNFYYV